MAMLQGNTYLIPIRIEDCDGNIIRGEQVEKGEFVFGDIVKYFGVDGEVFWSDGEQTFIFPLTERETFGFEKVVKYQGRVLLKNGSVNGSKPESEYIYGSIGKTILSEGESVGEESGKILTLKLVERVGGVGLESDPTVPEFVKEITEEDIATWNNKASVDYVDDKFNGANKSVAFDDYSSMVGALNGFTADEYSVGQNIMIVTLEVPDLWVSEIVDEVVGYTFVSDADFVNELKANGSVQVGHYKLSALETQKVDLTNYVKNTDYATPTKAGLVKASSNQGFFFGSEGSMSIVQATDDDIAKKTNAFRPITSNNMDKAVKVSLTTNTQEFTADDKKSARDLIGAVGNEDYATASKGGVVKAQNVTTANRGVYVSSEGFLSLKPATEKEIQDKSSATYNVISPANLDKAVKSGLTTNKEEFTAEEKQAARTLIGAVGSEDYASYDTFGVVKLRTSGGLIADKGTLQIYKANDNEIAAKEHGFKPIVPSNVDMAVKVGVTTNTIALTDEEKESAKAWLGIEGGSGVSQEDFDKLINNTTQIKTNSTNLLIGEAYSFASHNVAIGKSAYGNGGCTVAIGNESRANTLGVAIGYNARIKDSTMSAVQLGQGENTKANTLQVFKDNIYNHQTHTLTVQNIELNGVDLGTQLGDLNTALETILGV